jgi:hypothetical protein
MEAAWNEDITRHRKIPSATIENLEFWNLENGEIDFRAVATRQVDTWTESQFFVNLLMGIFSPLGPVPNVRAASYSAAIAKVTTALGSPLYVGTGTWAANNDFATR